MTLTPSEHSLISEVLLRGPVSRAQLATRLNLSAPSLTRLSKPFLESGLFTELDAVQTAKDPQKGRPRRAYDIGANYGTYTGINLAETKAYAVMINLHGEVLRRDELPLADSSPDTATNTLAELTRILSRDIGARPVAVGVSLGGQVRNQTQVARNQFLGWRDVPLGKMLNARIGIPIVVENDVTALAAGAHLYGVARGEPDFAVVTIGAGVGYGLVSNDSVVSTPDTGLGLGGHIPLDSMGPYCPQGHRGCATSLLTSRAITGQLAVARQQPITFEEFIEATRLGDPTATAIMRTSAQALGRFISLVANLTMHQKILLAGEGLPLWELGETWALAEINVNRDPEATPIEILIDDRGLDSWAIGAAATAIMHSLGDLALYRAS